MTCSRPYLRVAVHILHDEGMHDVSMLIRLPIILWLLMSVMMRMFMTYSRSCLLAAVHVLHDECMHEVSMLHESYYRVITLISIIMKMFMTDSPHACARWLMRLTIML